MALPRARRNRGALRRWALPCLVALALGGCVTNHDILAEPDGTGGSPGGGGTSGADGRSSGGSAGAASDGAAPEASAPPPDEPPGARKITVLHGVTDSPWVTFCFAKVSGGKEGPVAKSPFPAGGLSYAHSATLGSFAGVDSGVDGVRAYVVAADSPDVVAGMDCPAMLARAAALSVPVDAGAGAVRADAAPGVHDAGEVRQDAASAVDASAATGDGSTAKVDAGRVRDASVRDASMERDSGDLRRDAGTPRIAAVRARALPVIPEGALAESRSYLLVAGGCLGGAGVTDPSQQSVCGEGYSAAAPTLTEMLVRLSRAVTADKVGLQVLDGTPAVRALDLRLTPALHSDTIPVARSVVTGAIRPVPPDRSSSAGTIGASTAGAGIQLFADGGANPIYDAPWSPTLAVGDITGLENGKSYTLVVVGPYPGFSKRSWWNDPVVSVVEN